MTRRIEALEAENRAKQAQVLLATNIAMTLRGALVVIKLSGHMPELPAPLRDQIQVALATYSAHAIALRRAIQPANADQS